MTRWTRLLGAAFVVFAAALMVGGCRPEPIERVEWPAMGTVAAAQARGPGARNQAYWIRGLNQPAFFLVELLLNAHDPKSELSRLAPCADADVLARCANDMRPCYEAAFALKGASDGAFNPRWRGTNTLDLGAIAKGFAVDRMDSMLRSCRPARTDCLIDLGGNVKSLRGVWKTGVKDPNGDGFAAVVDLREGEALATSATYYRGGHIYDGRTGAPVSNDVASVTVLCRSAMWADGLSTTLFILGPDEGRDFLARKRQGLLGDEPVAALWILKDGRLVAVDAEGRFQKKNP